MRIEEKIRQLGVKERVLTNDERGNDCEGQSEGWEVFGEGGGKEEEKSIAF